jgi:epoxyqueuosine reductase
VARYAWGGDYHAAVEARLEKFRGALQREFGADVLARPTVDIQPLLERALGRRAGLGFVGKNTNLIAPGAGSFLFLATLVVSLELPSDTPLRPGCGACAVCRDRCPTGALIEKPSGNSRSHPPPLPRGEGKESRGTAKDLKRGTGVPFVLDARKCVAYHTIENRGPIPRELRAEMGDWLFGCDDCQEPCPYNARPLECRWPELMPANGPGAWVSLAEVLRSRTGEEFRRRWAGTSLLRAKRSGLARNACLVAVHRGAVDELRDELGTALRQDSDPLVRGHAAWALGRAGAPWAKKLLEGAPAGESDAGVREEIREALEGGKEKFMPPAGLNVFEGGR